MADGYVCVSVYLVVLAVKTVEIQMVTPDDFKPATLPTPTHPWRIRATRTGKERMNLEL